MPIQLTLKLRNPQVRRRIAENQLILRIAANDPTINKSFKDLDISLTSYRFFPELKKEVDIFQSP
jgi:hypothetical protein